MFILFFLIFSFPIAGSLNSAYIAIGTALTKLIIGGRISILMKLINQCYISILLISTFAITFLCFLWTILLGSFDFSLTKAFFSLLVGILSVCLVLPSLNYQTFTSSFIEKNLINVFVIQAIISVCAFISPSIREFVHHFQFVDDAEQAEKAYSGFRGLAISGRLYFEFAASCGLISFLQFKRIIDNNVKYIEYIKFFLIIVSGFFAGRTSLIGLVFGFIYLIFSKHRLSNKISLIIKILLSLLVFILLAIVLLPDKVITFFTEHLIPWVFDLLIKYHETGSTESSHSFNMLNDMYKYVSITTQEWICGSGCFMDPSGHGYYKNVDGGYIRHLLYWGIIGSIINLWYGLQYFIKPLKKCMNRNDILFIVLILIYTFFVHYKGDIATTSRFYHVIIVFLMLPYTLSNYKITKFINSYKWKELT